MGPSFDHQFGDSLRNFHTHLRRDRTVFSDEPSHSIIVIQIEIRRWILHNPGFFVVWVVCGKTLPSRIMADLLTTLQTVTNLVPFQIYSQAASNTVAALHMLPNTFGIAVGGLTSGIIFTRCVLILKREQADD